MAEDGNISDISEDPEFMPFKLPALENISIFDLCQVSGTTGSLIWIYLRYLQALDKTQLQHQKVLKHNKNLRIQVADLKSQLELAKRKAKGSGKPRKNEDALLNHELIVKLGKKYTVMVHPWPSSAMFMNLPAPDAPDPESKQRFTSLDAYEDGLTKELHVYLNDKELCERAAEYAPFKTAVGAFASKHKISYWPILPTQFLYQAKQERSAFIHTIRDCAPIILESIVDGSPTLWVANNGKLRKESLVLQGLLQFPNRSAVNDPFSPILYPNAQKNNQYLFMNEFQPKVSHLLK